MPIKTLIAASTVIPTLIIAWFIITSKNEKRSSNLFLGLLFFTIAILTISTILLSDFIYMKYFPIAHILNLFIYLLGPLFFLYVKSSLQTEFRFKKSYLLFFVPFIAVFLYFSYMTLTHDLFYGKHNRQYVYKIVESIQNAIFFFLIPVIAYKNKVKLKNFLFNFRDMKLTWIRFLYFSLIVVWFNKVFTTLVYDLYNNASFYLKSIALYFIFIGLFLSVAIYLVLNRLEDLFPKKKYTFSKLSEKEKDNHYKTILDIIKDEEPYLDPELSLVKLADLAEIPHKALSQIINEKAGLHFNEFINRYRIDYCCRLLKNPSNDKNILEIMLESGFNSKTTFNTAFRKIMKMTPVEYRTKELSA